MSVNITKEIISIVRQQIVDMETFVNELEDKQYTNKLHLADIIKMLYTKMLKYYKQ